MEVCEMKKSVLLLFMVLLVPALRAQDHASIPTLSVTGTGEVRAQPDQAIVRLGVTQEGTTAREAQQKANSVAQAILTSLRQLGIDSKQIQTSQLTLYPVYTHNGPEPVRSEPPRIAGYRASNILSVTVDKIEQVGQVVDAGLKAGSNQVEGITFGLKDDTATRQQALTQAAGEARRKAETIAKALNVQLEGIHEVIEGGVSVMPVREMMMMARADASTPVAPGEVTVNATLTVKYRISK